MYRVKQAELQQQAVNDAVHEMSKPLARYQDDQDLDDMLKQQDREGDPMLAFIKKKKAKSSGKGQCSNLGNVKVMHTSEQIWQTLHIDRA